MEGVTTLNMFNSLRLSTSRIQTGVLRAQTEVSTGRRWDVGLALGVQTGRNIDWRNQITNNEQQVSVNEVATARAKLTQSGLEELKDIGNKFAATMVGARSAQNGQQIAKDAALAAYDSIRGILGSTFEGQRIFSGTNTDGVALKPFQGGQGESAMNAAFAANFGVLPDDPGAANITPSQISGFMETDLVQEFSSPDWNTNWSEASERNVSVRIRDDVRVDMSANANHQSIRDLVRSVTAVLHASQGELASGTFAKLADMSASLATQSIQGIGGEQTRIGIAQDLLKNATDSLSKKSGLLKAHVQKTEGVDAYEAASRLNLLMTQLETSYSLTARISKLSLVNFV